MTSLSGIKTKKENYKSLKEEIKNIKRNINNEIYKAGVFINEKEEYVWRANQKKINEKSSPEQNYDINEILKYYELNSDKFLQGFTSEYFRKLVNLMSKIKYKKYSKERLDLFNSRINYSQKIYAEYLKKKGEDSELKSSLNTKIKNPFVTALHSYNTKNNRIQIRNKKENKNFNLKNNLLFNNYINNNQDGSSNNISTLSYKDFNKKLFKKRNKNESNEFLTWKNNDNKSNLNGKKSFIKYFSCKNLNKKVSKKRLIINNNTSFSFIHKNNSWKDINERDAKEAFLENLNQDKYFDFLRSQYNFFNNGIDKKQYNFELKTKKRKNMFSLKPNNQIKQSTFKYDFFKKMKRNIKNENSPIIKVNNSNSAVINRPKISELPSLSARFLKTMKFNKDCHSIYEKFKKTLINK